MESTREVVINICEKLGYKRENVTNTRKIYYSTQEKKQIKIDFEGGLIKYLSINGIVENVLDIPTFIKINSLN